MAEKFNESSRRALAFARYEAGRRGSATLEPEHLLLGILRAKDERVGRILAHFDVSADSLTQPFNDDTLPAATAAALKGEMSLSEKTKAAMAAASAERDASGQEAVAPEHLLVGVASVEGSAPAKLLGERGINLVGLKREVSRLG